MRFRWMQQLKATGNGDSHVIAVDKDSGILYELYNADTANGTWQASSGAIFHFNTNALRPKGWTSADAAACLYSPAWCDMMKYKRA